MSGAGPLTVRIGHRRGTVALDLAFTAQGGITALYGPSGAGKTTVLEAVAGLIRPREAWIALGGTILHDSTAGRFVPPHRRRIGCVFQDGRLFPHLTVAGNLAYGQRRGMSGPVAAGRIVALLGLEPLLERRPGALSGGERSRVALGRAVLSAPRLLLLDEPFSALDHGRREEVMRHLEALRDATALPMLLVSHDPAEIARLADHVAVMEAGRILRQGAASAVLADRPQAGERTRLRGRVMARDGGGICEISVAGGLLLRAVAAEAPGTEVVVGLAARTVLVSQAAPAGTGALNVLPAVVRAVEPSDGPEVTLRLDCGGAVIAARLPRQAAAPLALAPGSACHAILTDMTVTPAGPADSPSQESATSAPGAATTLAATA